MDKAERIASDLSDLQRMGFPLKGEGHTWWSSDGRSTRSMVRRGLINEPNYRGYAEFTPLGEEVRIALSKIRDVPDEQ